MSCCLYFVVPCYNDADTIPKSVPVFLEKLEALIAAGTINTSSRLMLIDDGSSDKTWDVILEWKAQCSKITAVKLAHNVGEQNALLAGVFTAIKTADCVITMDSDLQDDIHAVDEMIEQYVQGCDIVYGVRKMRKKDSIMERWCSALFYTSMQFAGTGLIRQHANFRLMSKKSVLRLKEYNQAFFYLPCVVSCMDVQSAVVYHERFQRVAGRSSYSIIKKASLAIDSLLAHSAAPITLIGGIAIICGLFFVMSLLGLFLIWHFQNYFAVWLCIFACVFLVGTVGNAILYRLALQKRKVFLTPVQNPRYIIESIVE